MEDCIFCKIAKHEIPTEKIVYEDGYVMAFNDLNPEAPVHVLVVPKMHISNFDDVDEENFVYLEKIMKAIKEVGKITGISEKGYRIINNCKEYGGQAINHLHFHVIGGTKLSSKINVGWVVMSIFFMRYRRTISLAIVALLSLLLASIYLDVTRDWTEKAVDGDFKIVYDGDKMAFETYMGFLKINGAQKLEYTYLDVDEDGVNEILIRSSLESKNYSAIIHREKNVGVVYDVSSFLDMSKVKDDGIFQIENDAYVKLYFENSVVNMKNYYYVQDAKYYYLENEITEEEYESFLKSHDNTRNVTFRNY